MSTITFAEHEPVAARHFTHGSGFRARILTGDLGAVQVTEVKAPSGECLRTPELIRRAGQELYSVDVLAYGHLVVEQDGREAALWPGDFTFIDASRPARYFHSSTRHVAVAFPQAMLPLPQADAAKLTAVRFPGDHGVGALVSSFARQLPHHLHDPGMVDGIRLGATIIDLVSAALAARLNHEIARPDKGPQTLLSEIRAFIERRLADPALSPVAIAAAHHISVRYLHKLFETQQTTVADYIRRRRLANCRRDLLDPTAQTRPVSAIAARWGFTDPAHFSRLFRTTYGIPPGQFRRSAQ